MNDNTPSKAKVFFIKDINAANLVKIYEALGREAHGRVAVKISTGEAGNPNHLSTDVIKQFVKRVDGTIVECNTAYEGRRNNTADHLQTAAEHGFTAIAEVDIMDAEGQVSLPVEGGRHIRESLVGKAWMHYDFTVVLSHFKGHPMAGFGGALKNIGIGLQSQQGKVLVHSAGRTTDMSVVWTPEYATPQDDFLESMAEACKADFAHAGENILFINVANNLSVDCDCVATPEKPEMTDLGIFASLDPVAVDRACVDAVYSSPDHGKKHLIERMESRNATHLLDYAEQLGLGTQSYELVELEGEPNGAVL